MNYLDYVLPTIISAGGTFLLGWYLYHFCKLCEQTDEIHAKLFKDKAHEEEKP